MIHRSRFLIVVRDLERGGWRKIYLNSALEFFRPTPLKVGLFDGSRLAERLEGEFWPNLRHRKMLAALLAKWMPADFDGLRLGVFCDDLAVVSNAS